MAQAIRKGNPLSTQGIADVPPADRDPWAEDAALRDHAAAGRDAAGVLARLVPAGYAGPERGAP
jgi:hypothetical protein